jgi:LacI family transcriptional regulator
LKEVATECSFQLRKPGRGIDRPGIAERKALQRWLADLPKPVGILCSSDWDAWDLYDACEQLGIRIRDEVGVVGMDNEDIYCQSLNPPLSSVERRPDRVGYEAAALMVKVLRGEGAPSEPILIAPLGVVQRESTDVFAGNDPHVATVARHIRDHAEQPLQVRDLLHLVPVSRRVLERRFRKHLSRSILEEIHRAKLNRIKHLLTDTDHTIDEISFLCGFPNSSHMTALFRQKTGQTPSEYRRQFRDKQSAQFDELASIRSRGPRPMSQIR